MDFRQVLKNASRIDADDVLKLRHKVFADMVVSQMNAEALFSLNNDVAETCQEWDYFFVEAMIDHCLNQAKPEGYLSDDKAEWVIAQIITDGHLKSDTELELLIRLIERAHHVPERITVFALEEIQHAVLQGEGELLNNEYLTPGIIGAPEAKLIRRIMYGAGSGGRVEISRAEVEILFELNDQTIDAENHPEWNDVFVKAVAAHLMMTAGYEALDRNEAFRREKWLDDTSIDVAGMLSKSLSSIGDVMLGKSKVFGNTTMENAWQSRNEELSNSAVVSEAVDNSEAFWLVERIGRDGVIHENEKALIRYLNQESPSLHSLLQPLINKVA
ncbi:MAG: hypothetical protein AAF217_08895 [Pseudomonadota bacterium]